MSSLTEALLRLEPTPPDEVKPRALPLVPRIGVNIIKPPGCSAWRVSVIVHLEAGPPMCLESSAPSSIDGWNEALAFVERATGEVLR